MIEMYLLEQLDAFARCGTLSAASEELHISQPALTRSMKKIEDLLDVKLFDRHKNRLALTDTGKLAASLAGQLVRENKSFESRVKSYDRSLRTISLGCCAPVPIYELAPCLQQIFPGMTIQTELQTEPKLSQGLLDGTYQLMVTNIRPQREDFYFVPCGHEHLAVAVPPDDPLAARDSISFAELADVPLLAQREVGFWKGLVDSMVPHAHILVQNDLEAFYEIRAASKLPVLDSDYYDESKNPEHQRRKILPITDGEANVHYYLTCLSANKKHFRLLFDHLPEWCRR